MTRAMTLTRLLAVKKLSLVLDPLEGALVGELARSLKPGGSIADYAAPQGFPVLPLEFIYNA
jgi:NADPH:quinone reductase-like Zn-dependent oxidoreductase